VVAFGQPAWGSWLPGLSAILGYALFWKVLTCATSAFQRFCLATAWFFAVQLVQLFWFVSHPYWYIISVYLFLSIMIGFQFGIIGILLYPQKLKNPLYGVFIALLWTVFEFSRLFVLSGFSFNPVGLSLTGNLYSLQMASLFGIYGLSFWVFLTNLALLPVLIQSDRFKKKYYFLLWAFLAAFPYLYGAIHIKVHENAMKQSPPPSLTALLVQTAFPVEETLGFNHDVMVHYVMNEWTEIIKILKPYRHKSIDLIVLPEFVVPFGTYSFVYPLKDVVKIFSEELGEEVQKYLPPPQFPLSSKQDGSTYVSNAYWIAAIANYFNADILAGLEDAEIDNEGKTQYYSSAQLFRPLQKNTPFPFPDRYEKRVLVPMGEYIPFGWCRDLAAEYGVFGSFTAGKEAKVMQCKNASIAPSICYEETFTNIIVECKEKGATLLVNVTSDVWYPNSLLPRQHFDHARLRTVETGLPLIRACNTGITVAFDSLGKIIAVYGGEHFEKAEWERGALLVDVPLYHYNTLYSWLMKTR